MSSRFFQSIIVQMKEATDRVIGVIDSKGAVIACSELSMIGSVLSNVPEALEDSDGQVVVRYGKTFKPLSDWNLTADYTVFVEGEDSVAQCICIMVAITLSESKSHYEEKYDKSAFVKNIILDNILPGDIYIRAKELNFSAETPRAVFLIRQVEKSEVTAIEVVQNLFPDRQKDFVISINETDTVLVKELLHGTTDNNLLKIASSIEQTINSELLVRTVIGIGTTAAHLRELADRYKEAQVAIEVGKVFDSDKTIINYENLGIGRLIYQLPTTLCEMFLSEVFKKNPIDSLDQETLYTINKFFENSLNVSETSRKLFVHRNTLVYRLEKIKKLTGLDLREFDYAIVFKVALMVKKYLDSQQQKTS